MKNWVNNEEGLAIGVSGLGGVFCAFCEIRRKTGFIVISGDRKGEGWHMQ